MTAAAPPAPPGPAWHYVFPRGLFGLAARAVRGIEWQGLENVPRSGRAIVAANHVSVMDPPLVAWVLNRVRFPHAMGKEELFRVPVFGPLLRGWGVIPLDRGKGDVRAIRGALDVLERDGMLMIFPEGTRSRTGRPGRPKPGVALLARESGAPVIPARVRNTERWIGGPLRVAFGPPMRYDGGETREDARKFAERVMESILSL